MDDNIGYIKVITFTKGRTPGNRQPGEGRCRSRAPRKLILDLRNCGAGEEQEGIATANLFLNHGMIAYLQGQKYRQADLHRRSLEGDHESAVGGAGE